MEQETGNVTHLRVCLDSQCRLAIQKLLTVGLHAGDIPHGAGLKMKEDQYQVQISGLWSAKRRLFLMARA